VDKEALKRLVAQRVVSPDDELCIEGDSRWVVAWKAKGLFPEQQLAEYGKPSAATAPASVASSGSISGDEGLTQELRKLASLRKEDLISQAEYERKKALLLGLLPPTGEREAAKTQGSGGTPTAALPIVEVEDSGAILLAPTEPANSARTRVPQAPSSTAPLAAHPRLNVPRIVFIAVIVVLGGAVAVVVLDERKEAQKEKLFEQRRVEQAARNQDIVSDRMAQKGLFVPSEQTDFPLDRIRSVLEDIARKHVALLRRASLHEPTFTIDVGNGQFHEPPGSRMQVPLGEIFGEGFGGPMEFSGNGRVEPIDIPAVVVRIRIQYSPIGDHSVGECEWITYINFQKPTTYYVVSSMHGLDYDSRLRTALDAIKAPLDPLVRLQRSGQISSGDLDKMSSIRDQVRPLANAYMLLPSLGREGNIDISNDRNDVQPRAGEFSGIDTSTDAIQWKGFWRWQVLRLREALRQ
jgi:hypothetical protein